MRQRITIILTFVVIIGLLVILNTVSYVQEDKKGDIEIAPNRSTYHAGPTGTRALHDLLNESGYKVIRWRETPDKLLGESGKLVNTFVVIGRTKIEFTYDEAKSLREWVWRGGRLVLIDRKVDHALAPQSEGWGVRALAVRLSHHGRQSGRFRADDRGCNCTATGTADGPDKHDRVSDAFAVCGASKDHYARRTGCGRG